MFPALLSAAAVLPNVLPVLPASFRQKLPSAIPIIEFVNDLDVASRQFLGEVFDEKSLRDLLIEAIRYGEDPAVRARLLRRVEGALDTEHLRSILHRNALCEEVMDEQRLFAVKEEMEKAEARKLQPYFIRAFFTQAFQHLGGELRAREPGRWEITHVPVPAPAARPPGAGRPG